MDPQEFITYLNDPAKLGKDSLVDIENLAAEFPYCQSLRILYLLNLRMTNQVMFSEQLKTTAAYIADRKRLKKLIASLGEDRKSIPEEQELLTGMTESISEASEQEPEAIEQPVSEPIVPVIEQDEEARLRVLKKIVEDRLAEITKDKTDDEKAVADEGSAELSKKKIIEKFIEEEPSITRSKADFFDPIRVAKKSQSDQDGIVTETLARIHIQQGNIGKAIEIYRKLSLKFPEKSSYFAAQIKKISTEN